MRRAPLLLTLVLILPCAAAAWDDDAGSGQDADIWMTPLVAGAYVGGLSAPANDTRDDYRLAARPGFGVGFELRLPASEAERSFMTVSESVFGDHPDTGIIEPDETGLFTWSGGTDSGEVWISVINFYGEFDYALTVQDVPMADLVPIALEVSEADVNERVIRVTVQNVGSAPSAPSEVALVARHFPPSSFPLFFGNVDSRRAIGAPSLPSIAPGESVVVEAPWNTLGEAGRVEVEALVTLWDARFDSNDARIVVDLAGPPLPIVDPLNTRGAAGVSALWVMSGTSSPNGAPGGTAAVHFANGPRIVSAEAGTSLDGDLRATACILTSCDDLLP